MRDNSPLRLAMLGILVVGLFVSLFARLWYLQVVTELREDAQAEAKSNLFRTVFVPAPRGRVLDRTGNVLIDNRLVNEVIVDKFTLFESLPREADRREFTIKLAREISAAGRADSARSIATMAEKWGLNLTTPSAEQALDWQQLMTSIHAEIRGSIVPADIYDQVQEILHEYRRP